MHLRKRVLVTGGSGFLGSHLCARLLEMGDEVLCVDNPSGIFTVAESRPLPVTRHAGWAVRFDSVTGK